MQMKFTCMVLSVMISVIHVQAADAVQACYDSAKTQSELNRCGGMDQKRADDEINAVYQAVIKKHHADAAFIKKLQIAQRAWLKWRDAEMEAIYPDKDDPNAYGSVFPMCWSSQLAVITEERIKQLRKWIDGTPEGDVCSGSIPVK
ncbi:DUF1311 domain-containing protein [Burkholderiaceae bacterium DAT-1]|nr:DUF1311 domain-containing protein [Burkholderiaceae bacterium DAT-1]